jgi:hypothetical protein
VGADYILDIEGKFLALPEDLFRRFLCREKDIIKKVLEGMDVALKMHCHEENTYRQEKKKCKVIFTVGI